MVAGMIVAIGDILAQTVYPVLFNEGKPTKNVKERNIRKGIDSICANMKQINFCRTLHFALLAFAFVVSSLGLLLVFQTYVNCCQS